jgi:uncharacterized repeat protein (TIGR01451 family)
MVSPAVRTITRLILVNSVACVCGAVVLSGLSLSAAPAQAAPQPKPTALLLPPIVPAPRHSEPSLPKVDVRDMQREAARSTTTASSTPTVSGSIELLSGTLSQDWGDFDRDGYLDLALGTSSGISVYHNLAGQLIEPAWSLPGEPAYGVRWADLNGDGRLELAAVGGSSSGPVRNPIYRFDGSTFTPTGVFTSNDQLAHVIALPGSSLDLIASAAAISMPCPVQRFRNNGRGQFTTAPQCVSTSATSAIGTADVDKDGLPDLVMGRFPNSLVFLKNKTGVLSDTNGVVQFDTSPSWPYDFAWGDYDGDGYLDLAAAFPLQRQARIYHNEGAGANPPFKLVGVIATQRYMTPLAFDWGDFNGDGALDLAVADDPPKIYFNVNQSIGTGSTSLTLGNDPTHENNWSTRAVALDNSNLDLSLSNQTGPGALIQMVGGHLQPQITPITGAIAANSVTWGDANGDGQIDLLLGAGSATERSTLYWNANGAFSAASSTVFPLDGSQLSVIGDLGKRDGLLEVVQGTSSGNIRVYTLTNSVPVLASSWGTGVPIGAVALGDYNNDGWLDLLTGGSDGSIAIYANARARLNSVPVFTARASNAVRSVAWADYDGDLYMDFAAATNPGAVYVYHNNQDGTFSRAFTFNETSLNTAVAWGDFNGDGRPDLAVGTTGQGVKLYENQNGQFSTSAIWTSPVMSSTTSLAWGDWNNDARPDLAVGNGDGPVQVYTNLGSQSGSPNFTLTWSSQEGGNTTGVAWGDANRDGYLDLAVSRSSGASGVYRNTSVLPWRLPNPPAYLSIARPGKTLDAYLYSSSELLPGYFDALPLTVAPTVTIYYSAYNTIGTPITNSVFEYSLDGGSTWAAASASISNALSTALTSTSAAGRSGVFIWDAQADGAISDNAVFRIRAADQISTGPAQRAAVAAISPPFRVRGLPCLWPNGLSIDYSPTTIAPFASVRFVGILAESSGEVMTYTWNFDDGTFGNGKEVTHAFDQEGYYTVRLSAVSATCPTPQPLQAVQVVKVGNPILPLPLKLYLPLVQKNSAAAQALSVKQAPHIPLAQRSAAPAVASSTCVALPVASLTSPTVPWIAATMGYVGQPALNSDGTRLAFWSTANLVGGNPDGNIELYYGQIDRVDSCITVTQITSSTGSILQGFNLGPSLNAAGDRVAFFSDRDLIPGENPDLNFEIFLARVTGTGISLTQVTSTTDRVSVNPTLDAAGTHIAFASDQDLGGTPANADGNQEIFVAAIDSAGQVLSTTQVTATGVGTFNDEPAISADGQQLAFVSGGNLASGGIQEIFVTTIGQSVAHRVTTSAQDVINYHPTINSDGSRLAFASATIATGTLNLATITGTTINITPVSTLTLGDQPALNAGDGTRLAALFNYQQVQVFNPDTNSVMPVFSCSSANCAAPAISGDGMHVAFLSGATLNVAYYETAALSITLASATSPVIAGSPVTYTFSIINHGPSLADSVAFTGSLLSGPGVTLTAVSTTYPGGACNLLPGNLSIECQAASLPGNGATSMPVRVVAKVDPGYLGPFTFQTRATAWQKNPGTGNVLTVSPDVAAEANLKLTKIAVSSVTAGDPLTYTIFVTNTGPSDSTAITITDQITVALINPAASPVCGLPVSGLFTCPLGALLNGTSASIIITATSDPNLEHNTLLLNTAEVTSTAAPRAGTDTAETTVLQPDLTIAKTHAGNFRQGNTGVYTLTVRNIGQGAVHEAVLVTDTLPSAALAATALAGSGWTCDLPTLVCTRNDRLEPGLSYVPIVLTVTVAGNAPTVVTNTADVATGLESDVTNNTSVDVTPIDQVADLMVAKTHTGNFSQGQKGASYAITVTNSGLGPTVGTVFMTDTVPAGLTPKSISGTGWTCPTHSLGSVLVCTRSDALAAGVSYPPIVLTVDVANKAAPTLINQVAVDGGGELNTTNNTAADATTIDQLPDLVIAKTHAGNFRQGGTGTYTITVSNTGADNKPNNVTVIITDALPVSLTATALSGTNWTCDLGTLTCSRHDALNVSASYEPIMLSVSVAGAAPASVTNVVTMTGGLDSDLSNNTTPDLTGIDQVADLTITKTHTGSFRQGGTGVYTITVSNVGPGPTVGTVTVTDTVPPSLTVSGLSGSGWSCNSGTVICTQSSTLAAGNVYPAIVLTVTVAGDAPSSVTNTVSVGGGGELNTTNNAASDLTAITQVADLTITKTHTVNFRQGGTGVYTITVSNVGVGSTIGRVTVTDTLPAGLTVTGWRGQGNNSGWTCVLGAITCTQTTALAAGQSYAAIILTVTVASDAPASVTNSALVGGGGELNSANNTAADVTSITQIADLTVAKSHTDNFKQGGSGVYTITVSNVGSGSTVGNVTVTDTLPSGLTATGLSGSGWSCTFGALTCTQSTLLAAGQAYPTIALTVTVGSNAAAVVSNTVRVGGGGELNTTNNVYTDATTIAQVADLTVIKIHVGSFAQGSSGVYTITVSNVGPGSTIGTVTLTDTLPPSLTVSAISNPNWNCVSLICTRGDVLAPGASYAPIVLTVTVDSNTPATVTNNVAVSGGGELNTANNTDADQTTIAQAADLSITKIHTGNFRQGGTGVYTLTVHNGGSAQTSSTIIVTDTLPPELTPTGWSVTSSDWTCNLSPVTCSSKSGLHLASGSSSVLLLTVKITNTAPINVTNVVTVSGGGELNTTNNTASDLTAIDQVADLTLTKTHTGNFTAGGTGVYTITVSNVGPGPTLGTVTLTDTLPPSLTLSAISSPNWSCAALVCTRSDTLNAGASYNPIVLTVTVAISAPVSLTNSASVSGGGELNTANNTVNDATPIAGLALPAEGAGRDPLGNWLALLPRVLWSLML